MLHVQPVLYLGAIQSSQDAFHGVQVAVNRLSLCETECRICRPQILKDCDLLAHPLLAAAYKTDMGWVNLKTRPRL
jgi:hypothetical protein